MEDSSRAGGVRARVRDELTQQIKDIASTQLSETGPDGLSLRAVARELGMVSSAVYRYFPSRDHLLTALIIDAYTAIGEAAEAAERRVRRGDLAGRWLATCRGARQWAVNNPHQYALIFGSPVPGYQAPETTIDPAARVPMLLLAVAGEAAARGTTVPDRPMPRTLRTDLAALRRQVAPGVDDALLVRTLLGWTALIGSISFELFGHLKNGIHDYDAYFDHQMRLVASDLGLT